MFVQTLSPRNYIFVHTTNVQSQISFAGNVIATKNNDMIMFGMSPIGCTFNAYNFGAYNFFGGCY